MGEKDFLLDGRPVRLLSGALHYFRVPEEHWGHRLAMLRAMGLNCVETYVPWNLHERRPGVHDDVEALGRFLDAAHAAGLWAIVRPGPYICAEWENGGLPHWLTGELGTRARTRDERFLEHLGRWFGALLPQVVRRQIDRGGPVIMVQAENEYGSYGSDAVCLDHLVGLLRELGVTVPLVTSDGPEDHMLTGGSVPGVLATVNFGSHAREAFEILRRHRPEGPLMCMEFWCGWFDHWGGEHITRDAGAATAALREILECGASVNLYMAHGGTSFAGWAGANRGGGALHDGPLEPDTTSYDYDAPIDEFGGRTDKFWRFREVLAEYAPGPLPEPPPAPPRLGDPAEVRLTGGAPLAAVLDALGGPEVSAPVPPTFEELDVDRGLVRYEVTLPGPRQPYPLIARGLRDLAVVYVDGERAGVLAEGRRAAQGPVAGHARVELWVESLGRVNTDRAAANRRASPGACCTNGSICTGYARVGCAWTRWTRSAPSRASACGRSRGTAPRGCNGAPSWCGAPGTRGSNCRAGRGGSSGSTGSTWAATGRRARSGRCMCRVPCCARASTTYGSSNWRSRPRRTRAASSCGPPRGWPRLGRWRSRRC